MNAQQVIDQLGLKPHPEGGHYRETFRDIDDEGSCASTAIYYLLEAGDVSRWHRVHGSAEVWHFYSGAPLALTVSANGHDAESFRLGSALTAGQLPQIVVPAGWWQTAESLGPWTLVGCTVAPGFDFRNFEMADETWRPVPRGGR